MTYDATLNALQRQWRIAVILYALGLAGLGLALRVHLSLSQTLLWLGLSGLIGFVILSYLAIHLPENIPPGELDPMPSLGPGTALSLMGGWLLAVMGGFMTLPRPEGALAWLPALAYLAALLADLFDGWLARRSGQVTRLGADLDMTLDGLGVLLAAALAVRWGQWPFWFLIVGLARYLFLWGLAWRQRQGLPTRALEDSVTRRLLAGMQRGFLFATLWPIIPAWLATATGLAFVIPFLVNFTYDWLVASAVIDDRDPDFRAALRRWQALAYGHAALAIRAGAVAALTITLWQAYSARDAFFSGLAAAGLGVGAGWALWFGGVALTLLLLMGAAPRLAAAVLYAPVSFILASGVSFWPGLLAFYGLTAVILLGPGPYAPWQPEAGFFTRRLGQDEA
ncbi:MAG TPA: hypothetical protein EYP25_03310 [Anaerolineae bacterium]|nr:hypothetical protein [Anaerolineae bacterium]